MNRNLILLPTALFIFCAGCSTGNITKTIVSQPDGGIYGFLRVKYAPDSPTYATTWQYRLYPSGAWSTDQTMGTTKQLTGATYYDVKFNPSGGHTVSPNPYTYVLVTADKKTVLELDYTP